MLKIARAPKCAYVSDAFSVSVREKGSAWQKVSVYCALTPNGDGNSFWFPDEIFKEFDGLPYGTIAKKTYISSFAFSGEVEIKVKFNSDADTFNIKPQGSITFSQNENEILFSLNKSCKLDIEPNGDIFGCLHLFAEEVKMFDPGYYANIIHFEEGYHNAENNKNIAYNEHGIPIVTGITDNTLIYAEAGAVVCAAVELENVSNVKIAGFGIFSLIERCYGAQDNFDISPLYSGFRKFVLPSIYIHAKCENIIIEDVTLLSEFRCVCIRNSKNIFIDNIKAFSHAVNGDGINSMNVCNLEVKRSYIHSSDDCLALFTSIDSIPHLCDLPEFTAKPHIDNVTVHDCILWSNARIFMIGGHATGAINPHNLIENVNIYNCEIIGAAADIFGGRNFDYIYYWSGLFRMLSQSEQHIRNITFKNIRTDWLKGYMGKPFHIEVRSAKDTSYNERSGGYRIEDITFKNISFVNTPKNIMPSIIKCFNSEDPQYGIENISFENVIFGGEEYSNIKSEGNVKKFAL